MHFASIVFDFDSTLVDAESLDLVCERALAGRDDREQVLDEIKGITTLGMEGKISFDESLSRRMALVAPHRSHVAAVAAELEGRITQSLLPHFDFFKTYGDRIYIVSGGFNELILPTARKLGIADERIFANAFVYDDSGVAQGVDSARPTAHPGGKSRALVEAGVRGPIAMVGDGYTDAEVKINGAAEAFVAFVEHASRERVVAEADYVASSFYEVRTFLEGFQNA